MSLSDASYARLLALRTGLRRFERWSEQQAQAAGLTPAQHQLLLAIRGHSDPRGPTIGDVADYLLLRHHSVVGLIDRADAAGLVRRLRDSQDHRVVRLQITAGGAERLEALSTLHLTELERLAAQLPTARPPASRFTSGSRSPAKSRSNTASTSSSASRSSAPVTVDIARVYDKSTRNADRRVLVDRLWPRGVSRASAPFVDWLKDVAPSPELRKWYGHVPERFDEFATRYRAELHDGPAARAVEDLRAQARKGGIVLVTATRDLDHSGAVVLRDVLVGG